MSGRHILATEAKDETVTTRGDSGTTGGPFAPLAEPLFRRIWIASLFSNFGTLIQGVGASWAMTQMTGRADLVAMVQSATYAPVMFGAVVAGAIADMYDRRKITLVALSICLAGAVGLAAFSVMDLLTPFLLLAFCFIVGTGTALFNPAWQSSVREQVPKKDLAAAIGLNSISFNVARSFGPAIGGVLVAAAGVAIAFSINALSFLPLLVVTFLWRRTPERSRLPPEGMARAVISGGRYVMHSPSIRTICLRTLLITVCGSSIAALMPLVAREMLHGDATTFGFLLGMFGIGAVCGVVPLTWLRRRLSSENIAMITTVLIGLCTIIFGLSRWLPLSGVVLLIAGGAWMVAIAVCNISVQLTAPRWVSARALAIFQSSSTAGIVVGSWAWGQVAHAYSNEMALLISGVAVIATVSARWWLPFPDLDERADHSLHPAGDLPEIRLDLTGRSGPVVIVIEYRVEVARAREFYGVMQQVQLIRQRTGAYGWSIARDVSDPELWTERYHAPTWHDYLRQRSRLTLVEHEMTLRAMSFATEEGGVRVRRFLERPFGSVRWTEDTPDSGTDIASPLPTVEMGA
jgi:MFS family permease